MDDLSGVRALLIDRDDNPQWDPAFLSDVSHEKVEEYFSPLLDKEDLIF